MKRKPLTTRQKRIKAYHEEQARTSAQRKRTIIPGPWTETLTALKLEPTLRENCSICESLGPYLGVYRDTSNWNEKGWYPISLNLTLENLNVQVQQHGLDQVLAACEVALNNTKRYGRLILLWVFSNNSQDLDPTKRFLSCWAKTNRRRLEGFMASVRGVLVVYPHKLNQQNQGSILSNQIKDLPA